MRLSWDNPGSRLFEAGVDRGVFFPKTGPGVPWNGLVSVREDVEDAGQSVVYMDGQKVVNQLQLGQFSADISAITYPDEMLPYDGVQQALYSGQKRDTFNLSYRSLIGNDVLNTSYGYRLHLIFNCMLAPSARTRQTLNDSSDISAFEWKLSTVPVATPYMRPTSHWMIDSPNVEPGALTAVENILYGLDTGNSSTFPTVQQLMDIFEANAIFTVTDNGNGTVTITGPDSMIYDDGTYAHINSPSLTVLETTDIFVRSY